MKPNFSHLFLSILGIRCESDYIQEKEKEELPKDQGTSAGTPLVYMLGVYRSSIFLS